MSISLKRRVEALEAKIGGDDVTLEEAIFWSMHRGPYDDETQRRYDDFERRCANSSLGRLIGEACRASRQSLPPGSQNGCERAP
jgi:hypothetical protein